MTTIFGFQEFSHKVNPFVPECINGTI